MKETKPKNASQSNTFSIMSMVFGGLAFILFPIFLGGAGIILAIIAKTKNEKSWAIGLTVNIVGIVLGTILGMLVIDLL